jgi:Protein of unknown function (DUF935)
MADMPELEVTRKDRDEVNPLVELGTTGLKRSAGYIHEEFLTQLQGQDSVKVFKEMSENDPIIGSFLFAIDQFLRKAQWRVEPANDDDAAEEMADFVRDCMEDMSMTWTDFISEVLSMLIYGYSYFEIVYKKRVGPDEEDPTKRSKYTDNKIGWRKFSIRSQDSLQRWAFDEDGGIQGMYQQGPPNYDLVFIPIDKSLLFRTSARKNNPEGRSVLRNAYRPWYFKKRIEEVEGVGIERDLAGMPIAFVPAEYLTATATPDQKATVAGMAKLVKNVRRDEQEGVIFPLAYDENNNKMFDFALVSSGSGRAFATDPIIERYDRRIAMTVLADFILLGSNEVGSYALSVSKMGMFQAALEAWLDSIAAVLNEHALTRLWRLNGFDLATMPKITHEPVQTPSLEELGTFISSMVGAGATLFPNTDLENVLMKKAGLPEREEEDDVKDREKAIREQNEASGVDVSLDGEVTKPPEAPAEGAAPPKPEQEEKPPVQKRWWQ